MEKEATNDYFRSNAKWVTQLLIAAVVFFCLGLILLFYFTCDYLKVLGPAYSEHFDHKNGLQDLANVLLGTTGLMWSLTATLLFVYTIFQTRVQIGMQQDEIRNQVREMMLSNATFEKQYQLSMEQRNVSMFFNLLENHTRLVGTFTYNGKQGYDALNELCDQSKESTNEYFQSIKRKIFLSFEKTRMFPNTLYSDQMFFLEALIKDVIVAVKFIDNFSDKDFYYSLLNNHLSVSEKYLIGLYCNFNITEETTFLKEGGYGFLSLYNHYYNEVFSIDNYFPSIKMNWSPRLQFITNTDDNTYFDIWLNIEDNVFSGIDLTLVKAILFVRDGNSSLHSGEINMMSRISEVPFKNSIANQLVQDYLRQKSSLRSSVEFAFYYQFEFGNLLCEVKHEIAFSVFENSDNTVYTLASNKFNSGNKKAAHLAA